MSENIKNHKVSDIKIIWIEEAFYIRESTLIMQVNAMFYLLSKSSLQEW